MDYCLPNFSISTWCTAHSLHANMSLCAGRLTTPTMNVLKKTPERNIHIRFDLRKELTNTNALVMRKCILHYDRNTAVILLEQTSIVLGERSPPPIYQDEIEKLDRCCPSSDLDFTGTIIVTLPTVYYYPVIIWQKTPQCHTL